jgi:hypothetical protein
MLVEYILRRLISFYFVILSITYSTYSGSLNKVIRLPSKAEPEVSGCINAASPLSISSENLQGLIFKKTAVNLLHASSGGVWVKRSFVLDSDICILSFFSEVGSR